MQNNHKYPPHSLTLVKVRPEEGAVLIEFVTFDGSNRTLKFFPDEEKEMIEKMIKVCSEPAPLVADPRCGRISITFNVVVYPDSSRYSDGPSFTVKREVFADTLRAAFPLLSA